MFSELRHNPRFQLQLKQSDVVPTHINQDWPGKTNFQREAIILEKLYFSILFLTSSFKSKKILNFIGKPAIQTL